MARDTAVPEPEIHAVIQFLCPHGACDWEWLTVSSVEGHAAYKSHFWSVHASPDTNTTEED